MKRAFAVTLLALISSGCATIIEGTTQPISVTSFPVQGAECTVKNSQGTYVLTTPATITVHKTKTDLLVHCKRDGYQDADTVQPSKLTPATVGNVLAGGLIGVGVDAASGANFYYDSPVTVVLQPSPTASNQPATGNGPGM